MVRSIQSHTTLPTRGVALVEVLVAVVIATIVSIFVAASITQYVESRAALLHDTQKLYLAEAGYEAVRFIRDTSWQTFADLPYDTTHYLRVGTSTIAATTTPETIYGRYERSFTVHPLYRDSAGEVVAASSSDATEDAAGRVIRVHVADERSTTTIESIVTNLFAI